MIRRVFRFICSSSVLAPRRCNRRPSRSSSWTHLGLAWRRTLQHDATVSNYIELSTRGGPGSVPELTCPKVQAATQAALELPPLSAQALTEQASGLATCRARLLASGINPNDYGADAAAADVVISFASSVSNRQI